MRPTLIFVKHSEIGGRVFHHGSELPPGLLLENEIDVGLDHKWLREVHPEERRSLYRTFHLFSGCDEEQPLEQQELASMTLRQ